MSTIDEELIRFTSQVTPFSNTERVWNGEATTCGVAVICDDLFICQWAAGRKCSENHYHPNKDKAMEAIMPRHSLQSLSCQRLSQGLNLKVNLYALQLIIISFNLATLLSLKTHTQKKTWPVFQKKKKNITPKCWWSLNYWRSIDNLVILYTESHCPLQWLHYSITFWVSRQ